MAITIIETPHGKKLAIDIKKQKEAPSDGRQKTHFIGIDPYTGNKVSYTGAKIENFH
ncbi:MAG: hypothetical protein V1732_01475 [Patescibacteria group bacterium]|nr:hypothetical protein [Patescibacteria group bacterium]MBU4141988.1 hypothetical protein [Patescibacteria group bacterium]